jgi:hypothetical protein
MGISHPSFELRLIAVDPPTFVKVISNFFLLKDLADNIPNLPKSKETIRSRASKEVDGKGTPLSLISLGTSLAAAL